MKDRRPGSEAEAMATETLILKYESPAKLRSGRASKAAEGSAATQSNSAR